MYEDARGGAGIRGVIPGLTQRISEGGGVTIPVLRAGIGGKPNLPRMR